MTNIFRLEALAGLLLCLVGHVSATGSWLWVGYRCYLPGCTLCETGNPYKCEECNTAQGYVEIPGKTCGCAVGYGSYAVPSVPPFPYYPPSCPAFLRTTSKKAGVVARTFYMNPKQLITPSNYYLNRPNYCWWGYHPNGVCQIPPAMGCGYCVCAKCPYGYTSSGGKSIKDSVCVPQTSPGIIRCKGKPPQVPHASPWAPQCANIPAGNKCGARGAPCISPYICSGCPANSAWPVAYCESPQGIWRVQGTCVAPANMVDCPNQPKRVANADPWPAGCLNGTTTPPPTVCNANCAAGYTGKVVATCTAGGWVTAGTCVKNQPGVYCPGSPGDQPNANPFTNCTNKMDGDVCNATCVDGFKAGVSAVCGMQADGTMGYVVGGKCEAGWATCAGVPADSTVDWPADCAGALEGHTCPIDGSDAPCAPGFTGSGGQALCQADGSGTGSLTWSVAAYCKPEGALNCTGLPQPNPYNSAVEPWPANDPVCNNAAAGDVCVANCAAGFTGAGAIATCIGVSGSWAVEVDCY